MDLVLFGIQGSGKGTQAKKLAAEFGYEIFEAGAELRKIAASKSELGKTVKSFIDVGNLVPYDIIMEVTRQAILARPKTQKILFDGVPRDLNQMRDFDAIMAEAGRKFRCVQLTLDPGLGIGRVMGRAKKEGRIDDADEEVIHRRMQTFMEKTLPVIGHYKRKKNLIEIDGNREMEEVYEDLKKVTARA